MWEHDAMTDEEIARETAALAELDELSAKFRATAAAHEKAREALAEAIIRHLMERNARPGRVAEHTPYDRNHVNRIARDGGVPTLRPAKPPARRRKPPPPRP